MLVVVYSRKAVRNDVSNTNLAGAEPAGSASIPLRGRRFIIATSGLADGPSKALGRFFVEGGAASVHVVTHPLVAEGPGEHRVEELCTGTTRVLRRPNRPPVTYAFDPITPVRLPKADVWVGFNCLVTAQGLLRRRVGRVGRVIHWSVDFVPSRFGAGPLTSLYERLDAWAVSAADARVELSDAAYRGRLAAYGFSETSCPAEIVPMGSWTHEAPRTSTDRLGAPRLVFLGHLVERMGVTLVVHLAAELRRRGRAVPIDIVGGGPMLEDLRALAVALGVDDVITFHGFVADFADVERVLASSVIGLAPYEVDESSFSRFADPGKLKAYLGAALPVLLTPVPPNASELVEFAGAELLAPTPDAFADAVCRMLDDPAEWERRHVAAEMHAQEYDWNVLFRRALPQLGLSVEPPNHDQRPR